MRSRTRTNGRSALRRQGEVPAGRTPGRVVRRRVRPLPGQIPGHPAYAGLVSRHFTDPAQQIDALDALARVTTGESHDQFAGGCGFLPWLRKRTPAMPTTWATATAGKTSFGQTIQRSILSEDVVELEQQVARRLSADKSAFAAAVRNKGQAGRPRQHVDRHRSGQGRLKPARCLASCARSRTRRGGRAMRSSGAHGPGRGPREARGRADQRNGEHGERLEQCPLPTWTRIAGGSTNWRRRARRQSGLPTDSLVTSPAEYPPVSPPHSAGAPGAITSHGARRRSG